MTGTAERKLDAVELEIIKASLDGIVQERRDGHVLVAAVLQHQRRDTEQVPDVRNIAPFPRLVAVQVVRIHQRIVEAVTERVGEESGHAFDW